ncbi:MAG: methionyl-tRNA formyltransferase, partial [Proteobacteria bacterium]|nr:methionyl-tRNA formyltransferase [Pseudomonadota bacterium]
LLPNHKGRQPLFWALASNDNKTGVTIHYIDPGIDTGDIIVQREIPISPTETLHSLYLKSVKVGTQALLDALDLLEAGKAPRIPQDPNAGQKHLFPKLADRETFFAAGRRFY